MTLPHAGEMVRKADPDRFLLSLFAKPERRPALWSLFAFNHEIARTREVVTDTNLGLIRLQWWRDALDAVYAGGAAPAHPVLGGLAAAIAAHDLPKESFDTLLYAREFDLEDRQPFDLAGLVNYADFTAAPLLDLACRVLGEAGSRDAAVAYALTGLLRAVPSHLAQRRCYLPAGMTPPVEALYAGRDLEQLKTAVAAVAAEAEKRLSVPCAGFAKAHAALAAMHLGRIRAAGCDLFAPRLALPPLAQGLRLWWVLRRG